MNQDRYRNSSSPAPKKSLGQVLLRDKSISRRIALAVPKDKFVVEIGCGDGALTSALLETGHEVMGIELDSEMVEYLVTKLKHQRHFTLLSGDVLKVDWEQLGRDHPEIVVTGNLPYHLATEILFALFDHLRKGKPPFISKFVFMVQKEVGLRLTAKPGNKVFGSITVLARYHGLAEYLFTVPADRFYPVPQVDGAIIGFDSLRHEQLPDVPYPFFRRIVRGAFAQRRKVLRNSVRVAGPLPEGWEQLDYDFTRRAETFSFEEYLRLSGDIYNLTLAQNSIEPVSDSESDGSLEDEAE